MEVWEREVGDLAEEDTQETEHKNTGRAVFFIQCVGVISQLCYDLSKQEVQWGLVNGRG